MCSQFSFHFGAWSVYGQKRLGALSFFPLFPFSAYLHRFHNAWEFWAYNVIFGLFQAPYYAFSQTMMAELSPPGYDNMFFGLFGLSNRASSMIGPNVIQAIIDKSGSNWKGFPFLFALCAAASLTIWFGVDVHKGRRDAAKWAGDNTVASRKNT